MRLKLTTILLFCIFIFACKEQKQTTDSPKKITTKKEEKKLPPAYKPNHQFKDYWYAGKAEITSYKLEQARYSELRDGKAVLVYVTEPFLPKAQVKSDQKNPDVITSCVLSLKDLSIANASSLFLGLPNATPLCQTMVSLVTNIS